MTLFNNENNEWWQEYWKGMPEFVQQNKEPKHKITVSFDTTESLMEFAKILGIKVTNRTKSLRFPIDKNYLSPKNFLYINES